MSKPNIPSESASRPHTLAMENRKKLNLTGVNEVTAFDEKQLILRTEGGQLTIDGEGLHVTSLLLEEGRLSVDGQINALTYSSRGASARRGLAGLLR